MVMCTQCKLQKPVTDTNTKGSQVWCLADINSYASMLYRQKTNPKLKAWWKGMSPEQRVAWYRTWQKLSAAQRSSIIQFVERGIEAWEQLDDKVYKWLPFEDWADLPSNRSLSLHEQTVKFQTVVDSCKSECKFVNNQWCIPRFAGLERRERHRQSLEIETFRGVDIKSAEQAQQVWLQMQKGLKVFKDGMVPTTTGEAANDPMVMARPEDQPCAAALPHSAYASVEREVGAPFRIPKICLFGLVFFKKNKLFKCFWKICFFGKYDT